MKLPNSAELIRTTSAPSAANCFCISGVSWIAGDLLVQPRDDRRRACRPARRCRSSWRLRSPAARLLSTVGTSGISALRLRAADAEALAACRSGYAVRLDGMVANVSLRVAADHVDQGRAAALERHVQEIDAGGELEQLAAQMREACRCRRTHIAACPAASWRARSVPSANWPASEGWTGDDIRRRGEHGDRRERLDRCRRAACASPALTAMRARDQQQRVAVLRRVRHRLGGDHAAGAGAVVDDDLPAQPRRSAAWRSGGRRCR